MTSDRLGYLMTTATTTTETIMVYIMTVTTCDIRQAGLFDDYGDNDRDRNDVHNDGDDL